MAPPMEQDEAHQDEQPAPTAVQKLINTVQEHLRVSTEDDRRLVFLAGALGGLSLFFQDEPARAMMLRLTDKMLDSMLELLAEETDERVSLSVLRFLCQWVSESRTIVQALLGSPHSATLSGLFHSSITSIATYSSLLLGLCLEYMGDEHDNNCGGWTKQSILDLLTASLSRLTSRLEHFKTTDNVWSYCRLERKVWLEEYQTSVLLVRKRVVQEWTAAEKDDEASSFQKVIAEQTTEIEQLRQDLARAQKTIGKQGRETVV